MSDIPDSFQKLNELAEQQKHQKSRLKGSLDQIGKSLKAKGYKNLVEARNDIKKIDSKIVEKKKQRDKLIQAFEKLYAKFL